MLRTRRGRLGRMPDSHVFDSKTRLLPASAYARLHLNVWTAAEDRLVSPEDLAPCVTLDGPQPPDPRHRYVIGLDLGLKNDRTVLAVCHAEHLPAITATGQPSRASTLRCPGSCWTGCTC